MGGKTKKRGTKKKKTIFTFQLSHHVYVVTYVITMIMIMMMMLKLLFHRKFTNNHETVINEWMDNNGFIGGWIRGVVWSGSIIIIMEDVYSFSQKKKKNIQQPKWIIIEKREKFSN